MRTIISNANQRVGIIKRTFHCLNKNNFLILFKSLVRPILEYCPQIWSPIFRKDILEIEKVQRRATKLVAVIKDLPYEQRLRELKLPTLSYRRKRSDIIEVFKIMKGFDKIDMNQFFTLNKREGSRGHTLKLVKPRAISKLRQHSFSNRIINIWNSLPQNVIDAESINSFKNRLEKAWADDPGKFDPLFITCY